MPELDFQTFRGLTAGINKRKYYDAIKPELQNFAEIKFGQITNTSAYENIFQWAYTASGGVGDIGVHDYDRIVRRMGKGREGRGNDYGADRIYADRVYYFFLFDEEHAHPAYGDRISENLFGENFYDHFIKDMRRMGIKRPKHLSPIQNAYFGPIAIALSHEPNLLPLNVYPEQPTSLLTDGQPDIFAALHWRSGLSALRGRTNEFNQLIKWAIDQDTKQAKVMLVSGPGGVGKTRLVADVVSKLRSDHGWSGGFLPNAAAESAAIIDGSGNGVVLIIDYPEEKTGVVEKILKASADETAYNKPVRIILASREDKSSWLERLNELSLERLGEISLTNSSHLELEDAISVINEVCAEYPMRTGFSNFQPKNMEQWLSRDQVHSLPLFLVAASIHAILEPKEAFQINGQQILLALAKIEMKRVRGYSTRNLSNLKALEKIIALSVFADPGISAETVRRLGDAYICPGMSGIELLQATRSTPFWNNGLGEMPGHVFRIEPDRVAAAFCLIALELDSVDTQLSYWLPPVAEQQTEGFASALARIAMDVSAIDEKASTIVEDQSILMLDEKPDLVHLFEKLPFRQVSAFSAKFSLSILTRCLQKTQNDERRVKYLNNQSVILSNLERFDEALSVVDEAVAINRQLAHSNSENFRPELAKTLGNRANFLIDLSEFKQAEVSLSEAINIYESLVDEARDNTEFLRGLGRNLNSLAVLLLMTDRINSAHPIIGRAVEIRQKLSEANTPELLNELGTSLNILAHTYSLSGEVTPALQTIRKATIVFRRLVELKRELFLPSLAGSLHNQTVMLMEAEKYDDALKVLDEVILIRGQLSKSRPNIFLNSLAESLNIHSNLMSSLGRYAEALPSIEEAVKIQRRLAVENGKFISPGLASSLENKASRLEELGRRKKALLAITESIAIREDLEKDNPGTYANALEQALRKKDELMLKND